MIKGKTIAAGNTTIKELDAIRDKKLFPIGSDGKVKSGTPYKFGNYICIPGKEIFLLVNDQTGKTKRAKKIFVIHTYGDM